MTPPSNNKEVCLFVCLVNYYRDMWYRRSRLLNPLTALTSPKVRFKWADVEQKTFDDIKCTVAHDTLLSYPDFNKRFGIHTDIIDSQLGATISHNGKPITFYSRKLTETQM